MSDSNNLVFIGFVFLETYFPAQCQAPAPGEEEFVPQILISLGGAFTSAYVSRTLGATPLLFYPAGKGIGDLAIQSKLEALGLESRSWPAADDTAVSMVFSSDSDRSFLSAADFDSFRNCPAIPEAEWIHVVGLREAMLLDEQLQAARENGTKVSVSTSWAPDELVQLRELNEQRWDFLTMNRHEAVYFAGSAEAALERLGVLSADSLITLGSEGAVARVEGRRYETSVAEVPVLDPNGAGDTYCAAYLSLRRLGLSAEESLSRASRAADFVVQSRGFIAADQRLQEQLEGLR